jgi:putative membrane protein
MEPAAIALDYWHWEGGSIPAQNYAAWFLIAALWAFIYRMLHLESRSRLGLMFVCIQLFFFIALRAGGVAFP